MTWAGRPVRTEEECWDRFWLAMARLHAKNLVRRWEKAQTDAENAEEEASDRPVNSSG